MKSLRDYKLHMGGSPDSQADGITPGTAFSPPIHALVNGVPTRILAVGDLPGTAFSPPIHALVNGVPTRILAVGDLPGASPVYLCTDGSGFSTWVKLTDATITDGAYLPLTAEPPTQVMR